MSPGRRKADDPALRSEVEGLRRRGETLNRAEIGRRHGVGAGTVQLVRSEIDQMLAAEAGKTPLAPVKDITTRTGGRTVMEFDGRRLLKERRRRTLIQEELAELAGISRGEIGHLERCRRKPTLRTLRRLAKALHIRPSDLLVPEDKEGRDHEAGVKSA
jgi:DNA-binding XRE family transcriptional regulator